MINTYWGMSWGEAFENQWTDVMISLYQRKSLYSPSEKILLHKSCDQIIDIYVNLSLCGDLREQFSIKGDRYISVI